MSEKKHEDMISAAHHESGHVIVAGNLGWKAFSTKIKYIETLSHWEGVTEYPELQGNRTDAIEIQLATSLAGCFAQFKHAAILSSAGNCGAKQEDKGRSGRSRS